MKIRSWKSRKIDIFPKGLTHGFGIKMVIFRTFFFFRQNRLEKCLLRYSRMNKGLSRLWTQEVETVEKFTFFSKGLTLGFGIKMAILSNFFFFGKIGKKKVFYDILQHKNSFLGYKNNKFEKKLTFFLQRLSHGFGLRMAIFPTFFFRQYRLGKCLLPYSRTKKRIFRL